MTLKWDVNDGQDHYRWFLSDGSEVRVESNETSLHDFMEPEEAFIAALSSCHLLSFMTEAARAGFTVSQYDDAPQAVLGQNEQARIFVKSISLQPSVTFAGDQPDADTVKALHQQAHDKCFIAQSIKSEILLEPRLK